MQSILSFEQAPPISVPYRFFLTAPLFGVLAGLLVTIFGAESGFLSSRWTAEALAITHALAVGFVLQAVCGAMLQFVPVAAGANVWRPRLLATLVHPLLILGAIALLLGLALSQPLWLRVAGPLFVVSISGLVVVVTTALWRTPARGMTIVALRLSVFGLAVTTLLGVTLASALAWALAWPLPSLTDVHAVWGLAGWALILIAGVSYFVVPMFQLTPSYPTWVERLVPSGLFGVCVLWSGQLLQADGDGQDWELAVTIMGMLLLALYGWSTLRLLQQRRRKLADVTFMFWRGAMLSLLSIPASWAAMRLLPTLGDHPRTPFWFGTLMFVGVLVSLISGMLYKIVPFLNWMHLQRLGGPNHLPPNMKQMISERSMRGQMRLHFVSLALLLAAVWEPAFGRPGGLAFAISCAWLEWNLVCGVNVYRRASATCRTLAGAACRES